MNKKKGRLQAGVHWTTAGSPPHSPCKAGSWIHAPCWFIAAGVLCVRSRCPQQDTPEERRRLQERHVSVVLTKLRTQCLRPLRPERYEMQESARLLALESTTSYVACPIFSHPSRSFTPRSSWDNLAFAVAKRTAKSCLMHQQRFSLYVALWCPYLKRIHMILSVWRPGLASPGSHFLYCLRASAR